MPENASQPPSYSPEVLARIQEAFDDVWSALYANIPEDSHSAQLRATLGKVLLALASQGITSPQELRRKALELMVLAPE